MAILTPTDPHTPLPIVGVIRAYVKKYVKFTIPCVPGLIETYSTCTQNKLNAKQSMMAFYISFHTLMHNISITHAYLCTLTKPIVGGVRLTSRQRLTVGFPFTSNRPVFNSTIGK